MAARGGQWKRIPKVRTFSRKINGGERAHSLEACKKRHLMDNFLDDFHNKFHWIKKKSTRWRVHEMEATNSGENVFCMNVERNGPRRGRGREHVQADMEGCGVLN